MWPQSPTSAARSSSAVAVLAAQAAHRSGRHHGCSGCAHRAAARPRRRTPERGATAPTARAPPRRRRARSRSPATPPATATAPPPPRRRTPPPRPAGARRKPPPPRPPARCLSRRAWPTSTVRVSGLPPENASSGRHSFISSLLAARARPPGPVANCKRSVIGIGGTAMRRGRSPSQSPSSRREVRRKRARVSRAARRKSDQLALLLGAPRRLRRRPKAGHRLDVVPDPQHRHLVRTPGAPTGDEWRPH